MAFKQLLYLLSLAALSAAVDVEHRLFVAGARSQCTAVTLSIEDYTDFTTWGGSCQIGHRQSPVNLPSSSSATASTLSAAAAAYGVVTGVTRTNTGNGPKISPPTGHYLGSIQITFAGHPGPIKYNAIQFHTHVKSEHTVAGTAYDAELHIVHQLDPNQTLPAKATPSLLSVVGVWLQMSPTAANNSCLEKFISQATSPGCSLPLDSIDMSCFAPQLTGGFWSYNGSLTSPPCTEVVTWFMTATPMVISSAQLANIKANTANRANNRPTQALNGRTVYWTAAVSTAIVPAGTKMAASTGSSAKPSAMAVLLAPLLLSAAGWK